MNASSKVIGLLILASASSALADQNLQFHGYFRTTLGLSEGRHQPAFQAPGANSKYRLGNEPDTTLELAFDYRYSGEGGTESGRYIQGFFMLAGYQPVGNSSDMGTPDAAQFYIKFAQYLGPFDLWVGRRYYQRMDIHINDHFWLNVGQGSHVGAGMEDLVLGSARLDLALFNYEDPDVVSQVNPAETGTLHSRLLDLRVRKIPLGDTMQLNTWLSYAQRPEDKILGYRSEDGYGAGAWLDMKFGNATDTLVALHRRGLSVVQGDFNGRPVRENLGPARDLNNAAMLEINNNLTLQSDVYALQFALVHRQEKTGIDGAKGDGITWQSAGIRPVYYFSDITSAALEVGYDQVDNEITDRKGSVLKETIALQLHPQPKFYARPTLSFFVTNANWSEDFKGLTAASVYADQTSGWSAGFQTDVFW
jgi:maltoporin